MKFNLYPYNVYILLGCCFCVILFLFIALFHLGKLGRSLQKQAQALEKCSTILKKTVVKQEVLAENHQAAHRNDKYKKVILPFALAIFMVYHENKTYKGLKGYKQATKDVLARNIKLSQFEYLFNHFNNL